MHLWIILQITLPPAGYEYPFHSTLIKHYLFTHHGALSLHLIFARFLGKPCYLIVLIGYSLMISEVEHFLDYIDWLLPNHYCGHSSPVLAWRLYWSGCGAFLLQVTNNPSHIIEKCRGRKVIFKCNWIQAPKDVFWASCLTVILNFAFSWVVCLISSSFDTFVVAASPELTPISVRCSWQIHPALPRNHTRSPLVLWSETCLRSVGLLLAWLWATHSVPGTRARVSLFRNELRRGKAGSFSWTLRYHYHTGAKMGDFHH